MKRDPRAFVQKTLTNMRRFQRGTCLRTSGVSVNDSGGISSSYYRTGIKETRAKVGKMALPVKRRTNRAKVPADYVTARISKILQHVYDVPDS